MPSGIDVIIICVVVVAFVFAVISLVRGNRNGCADCASAGTCNATITGRCAAADDMVARAEKAFQDKDASSGARTN